MVLRTVKCTECDETRVGRDVDDGIVPYRRTCPECGGEEFEIVGE